jgi:hypothetical protein
MVEVGRRIEDERRMEGGREMVSDPEMDGRRRCRIKRSSGENGARCKDRWQER